MRINEILTEAQEQPRTAVVGWGRGMGHSGHMLLAGAVIEYAKATGAQPFFFVSETVGADDPLLPEEKLAIYKRVFPKYKNIFKTAQTIIPALTEIQEQGFDNLVFVVGEDQKNSFKFLQGKTKAGLPVLPYSRVQVISRQDVAVELDLPELAVAGPRATPMRDILKDQNATTEQKFKYWRDAMPNALNDGQVMSIMKLAAQRMKVPVGDTMNEADQPPTGATFSPLSAANRPQPKEDPRAKARERKLKQWMGHRG